MGQPDGAGPADNAARGEERTVEIDGLSVHTVTWWPAAAVAQAPPLVLLHGLGGSTVGWELVGAGLAAAVGAPVTAADLVGFGRTRTRGQSATFARNATLLTGLLQATEPSVVVGNSMGGALGVHVAARAPALVRGLVLVTPALPQLEAPGVPEPLIFRNLPAVLPFVGPALLAFYNTIVPGFAVVDERMDAALAHPERLDPGIRTRLVALQDERRAFAEGPGAYADAARSLLWHLNDPGGMPADLGAVRAPTLIVHGERDRLVPLALARALAAHHPDWELIVYRDTGHLPHLEQPGPFVRDVGRFARALAGTGSLPTLPEAA